MGDYLSAWTMLEPLDDARDASARAARVAVARAWLLRARVTEGRGTYLDITNRLTPTIAAAIAEGGDRERAEAQALLGFMQFLRSQVEPIQADPARVYRKALKTDPDCALAHLLLGSYLTLWGKDAERGLHHLQRAVDLQRAGQLRGVSARERQLRTLVSHCSVSYQAANAPGTHRSVVPLVRVLNDIRREGGALHDAAHGPKPEGRWRRIVYMIYRPSLPTDAKAGAVVRDALPVRDHAATLQWLDKQNPNEKPNPWLLTWKAHFEEQAGDKQGALATYARMSDPPSGVAESWDDASLRMTGKPHRALSLRDPWAHAAKVIGSADPDSREYTRAFQRLDLYMKRHARGAGDTDPQALKLAEAAWARLAERKPDAKSAPDSHARVGLHVARLRIAVGRPGDAIELLTGPRVQVDASTALRGELLVALAVAYVRRSRTEKIEDGDLDNAVARLVEAVDAANYADWARIRWFEDLKPLYTRPEYAALLGRHGRKVGGAFGR